MSTIKEVLLDKIATLNREIEKEDMRLGDAITNAKEYYNNAVRERQAQIKAMQSMIALYEKHSQLYENVTVEVASAAKSE